VKLTIPVLTRCFGAAERQTALDGARVVVSVFNRALLAAGLAFLAAASYAAQPLMAQTPTVQLTNLTRGGTNFIVGDYWRIDVTGPPDQEVKVCATFNGSSLGCTAYGQTDSSGNFQLSGFMDESTIGTWVETWYVGDVQATPVLYFEIYPPPCTGYAIPIPPVMFSTDYYYYPYNYYPDSISQGSSLIGAQITSANCAFNYTSFQPLGIPQMISAGLDLFSPLTVIWLAYDNGNLGFYGFDERCYFCFYPVIQSAGFTFIAVDNYGNLYIMNTGVVLYVDKVTL